jgi:hypothetical protein
MLPHVFSSPCCVTLLRRLKMFAVPRCLGLNFPLMCMYSTRKTKTSTPYYETSSLRFQINIIIDMEAGERT